MPQTQLENTDIDNLLRPDHLAQPCTVFRYLQDNDPVHWNHLMNGWMISCYDDVRELLQGTRLSSATPFGYIFKRDLIAVEREAIEYIRPYVEQSLLNMDPPGQQRQRNILRTAFTARRVTQMEERIRQFVYDIIDEIQQRGKIELIHDFAFPLLFRIIFEMLGIPEEKSAQASRLFNEGSKLIIQFNSLLNPAGADLLQFAKNLRETEKFLQPIIDERRKEPKNDIISVMVQAQAQGELSEKEIYVLCSQLVFAAHETTANAIGTGIWTLLSHPDQLELMLSNSDLLAQTVQEVLRYAAPGQMRPRIALEDFEVKGIKIQKGQRLFLMLAAANYDPAHFSDPEKFNIQNPKSDHIMTFGYGIHYCLGAALAQLELQIIYPTLFQRLPGLRLASQAGVQWRPNFLLRGLSELPLEFDTPTAEASQS